MLLGTLQSRAHSMQTNLNGSVLASLFISAIVFHTEKFVAVRTPDSALIWTVREIELGIETEKDK